MCAPKVVSKELGVPNPQLTALLLSLHETCCVAYSSTYTVYTVLLSPLHTQRNCNCSCRWIVAVRAHVVRVRDHWEGTGIACDAPDEDASFDSSPLA